MKKTMCFVVFILAVCLSFVFAGDSSYKVTAKDQSNGNIMITLTRVDDPVFDEIVDANGNVFVTLKNITGVNKRTDIGLPATLSKNVNVYLDGECNYTPEIIKAEYDEIPFKGIFEVGRELTRKMDPAKVPYEPNPTSLSDGNYYPCETEYLAGVEFGNIRNMFRIGTVTVQLTMVNPSSETLRICKYLKFKLVKKNEKGKNALENPGNKKIKCGGWVNSVERMALNLEEGTRAAWPHELSEEGDILVIYTSRDASAIQPYITHKQGLGYNVQTQQVSTGTDVQTTVQNAYNANPNLMYVQLVGDWEDIKCAYDSSKYPQDTELGLAAGSDNYLDMSVGRFSAASASDVTTQVNKTIAWENNLPVHGFMIEGLGIGSPEGTGDDSEYDYQHIDVIKENKLLPNQYTSVDECYQSYSSSCITNSVNAGVGVINYCGHGSPSGWTSFSSTNVTALTNGSATPFIFSVACNVGDYDGYTCFAEVWLRKTNGGAVAALMSTYSQPWNPPMIGQDYYNDMLTGGYNYSTNPGNGTNTDHGKEILGSIIANGMILWISESSTSSDVLTMKNWTLFGDCALRVFGEAAPPSAPVANFTADTQVVSAGGSVHFTDLSTNSPTSWSWTFESGTPSSSTSQNPTVTYNTAGTYDVSLTAANSAGSDGETKTNYITVTAPQPPVANFTASTTNPSAGGSVTFTDTSTNTPTSWSWTFEGGTPGTSTAQNPTITYNTTGTYDVSLTATNAAGSDGETKVDYINVSAVPYCTSQGNNNNYEWISRVVVAGMDNSSGSAGYTDFTSITCNLTSGNNASVSLTPGFASSSYTEYWKIWIDYNGDHDFTDTGEEVFSGSGSSTVSGSFTVASGIDITTRMRVTMKYGGAPTSCETFTYGEVEDYTAQIAGAGPQPPVAAFTANTTSVTVGGSVSFNDQSTNNPTSWSWVFEGGTPGTSTSQNPTIQYNSVGTFDVTLTAYNSAGSDPEVKLNYITATAAPQPPVAAFTASTTTVTVGGSVNFTDQSTNSPTSWSWAFEGGTPSSSTSQNPTVTYNSVGTFNVSLTAYNIAGSDNETKVDYITVNPASGDEIAEAVDNETLTFTKSGNADWYKVTDVYYYDGDAAKSGTITHNQSTTIETDVTVGSTQAVKFYWKVSSEASYDYLRFYIDGVQKTSIAGTVDWTQVAYNITAGTHTLKWSYTKDGSVSSGSDCGWVDKLEITAPASDPIAEAVDYPGLTFTLSGNANWFSQTSTTYYGGDAAQSGDIGNNQTSTMETTISGKTSVKFYWRVSSETNYDYLRFYIDGVQQHSISGSTSWAQRTYTVSSGTHTLKWSFTKDGSVSSGSDCGWVDKLELQ
jgi:PKD repeat protein